MTSFDEFEVNEEGEVEECSWRAYFEIDGSGYQIIDEFYKDEGENGLVKGLLEFKNIRKLYKDHTRNAEVVDYYHSMYPEE